MAVEYKNLGKSPEGAEYQNLSLPSLPPKVTCFAWVCSAGAVDTAARDKMDALHIAQGKELIAHRQSLPALNAPQFHPFDPAHPSRPIVTLEHPASFHVSMHNGLLVVGIYDDSTGELDWIQLRNVPNTGSGGPRSAVRLPRTLAGGSVASNGNASIDLTLPGHPGGAITVTVDYFEDDGSTQGMTFGFHDFKIG